MNGVSLTILHFLPRFKRYVNYLLGYTRSKVQTLQMRIRTRKLEKPRDTSARNYGYTALWWNMRGINRTNMTQHCEDWCPNDFLYLVQTPVVVYLSPSARMSGQPQIGYSFRIHSHLAHPITRANTDFLFFIYL